jgi:hypothetical protein
MTHTIFALVLCTTVWFIGCATSEPVAPNPIGKALLGKSKQELVSCAGSPLEETNTTEGIVLTYYKEAPIFEESFYSSKGSVSRVHHGCWAHLLIEDDRVVGVEYRSAPEWVDATDHCEEIFKVCAQ